MRLFAVDDVLVGVIGVVWSDMRGDGFVPFVLRQPLGVAFLEERDEFGGFTAFAFPCT